MKSNGGCGKEGTTGMARERKCQASIRVSARMTGRVARAAMLPGSEMAGNERMKTGGSRNEHVELVVNVKRWR